MYIFEVIIMNIAQNVVLMILRSNSKLGHLGQKLGHRAKSKENFVNTLEVTYLKLSPIILLKIYVLMISRSSLKLGHLGPETRSLGKSKENLC